MKEVVMVECPYCHNANEFGDYEGPTCEVCDGEGYIVEPDKPCKDSDLPAVSTSAQHSS
jgi:hypothetical protein